VEIGTEVTLNNIYFETGKANLKPKSFTEIDYVVKLMKSNPTLRIEIAGHTDTQGALNTNMRISRNRAKAVADYIEDQGIDGDRLEYKGYGYTKPVAPNNTPEGRAKNRRVEFKVLNK
jgi:outer membrane protein OmpA-like peptidoglycan-associated protein